MSAPVEFVAFDLETTGLSPRSDRVLEIGAVRFDAAMRRLGELDLVVNPGIPIPLAVQRLVGLTDGDVAGAPDPVEGVAQLADFCDGAELIAHGAGFDITFCAGLVPDAFARRRVLDTLELARILLPVAASHSLPLLSADLGLEHDRPHRALSDASATHHLFAHLVGVAEALPAAVLAEMRRVAQAVGGDLDRFLAEVVRGDGDPLAPARPHPATAAAPAPPPVRRSSPPPDLAAASVALLGPDGGLGGHRGYELREAQLDMTRAVAQAIERRRRLIVEAGTGIGKSLAYLAPLALHSRNGRRAVVATRTITLQEQLIDRDIPMLETALGERLPAVLLKGRNHQVSLRRWQRFLRAPDVGSHGPDVERARFKLKLLVWLCRTETGDRAELHLNGAEEQLWRHVESDGGDCLGAACANWQDGRCFMVTARRAAQAASIVVTNHALLLADAGSGGGALGDHDVLVIDEAHHLEEVAAAQLGTALRAADVHLVLDRLDVSGELGESLTAARDAATRLFGDVKGRIGEILGADHSGNAVVGLRGEAATGHGHGVLLRSALHAGEAWRAAAALLREEAHAGSVQTELLPQPGRAEEERLLAAAALDELAGGVERVLIRPPDGHVAWLELRAEQGELHEAPASVAEALRDTVYARADAVIATSATLAVAGDFGFSRTRLGLDDAEELVLASPFDFLEQALCILPSDVPPYDDGEHDRALALLIGDTAERLGGSTLALFTGYAPLRRVHALLNARLGAAGIALLGQGLDGTRRQILGSFLANRRTVLLGTTSFWEGIDVPGDALRCVVIAKLPFAVPTDPLVAARTQGLADPFGQYALPQAVLRLRQGFGRLIRHGTDRGAVVLCDERLRSREYGERFMAALPPARVATLPVAEVGETVAAFVLDQRLPDATRMSASRRQSEQHHSMDEEPA